MYSGTRAKLSLSSTLSTKCFVQIFYYVIQDQSNDCRILCKICVVLSNVWFTTRLVLKASTGALHGPEIFPYQQTSPTLGIQADWRDLLEDEDCLGADQPMTLCVHDFMNDQKRKLYWTFTSLHDSCGQPNAKIHFEIQSCLFAQSTSMQTSFLTKSDSPFFKATSVYVWMKIEIHLYLMGINACFSTRITNFAIMILTWWRFNECWLSMVVWKMHPGNPVVVRWCFSKLMYFDCYSISFSAFFYRSSGPKSIKVALTLSFCGVLQNATSIHKYYFDWHWVSTVSSKACFNQPFFYFSSFSGSGVSDCWNFQSIINVQLSYLTLYSNLQFNWFASLTLQVSIRYSRVLSLRYSLC